MCPKNKSSISITTFGDFDISMNGHSVFKKGGRKYKNLELLKFFITNRNRRVLPESIIDNFWSDKEYEDPKNALSTQVHRLKKSLTELGILNSGKATEDYLDLNFINGYYLFSTGKQCMVDADLFKEKIDIADKERKDNPDKAIDLYLEAVELYRGLYMEDNLYSEWAVTVRNKFHRMFIQSAIKLMDLLKQEKRFEDIVQKFEDIVAIEPYEEGLHIYFMEALMELKEYRYALSHYNYVATKLEKDIGVRPSFGLKKVYRKILSETDENEEVDAFYIDRKLTEEELIEGSIFCETDYFKFVYNLERRKSLRYGKNSILMIVTLVKDDSVSKEETENAVNTIKDILWQSLRKSDLLTRWNHHQLLILLINTKDQNLQSIQRRVEQKFEKAVDSKKYQLNITSKYVSSDQLV